VAPRVCSTLTATADERLSVTDLKATHAPTLAKLAARSFMHLD
jgi:hypothetical protein